MNIFHRLMAFLILLIFELNLSFSATYSGKTYSGKDKLPVTYAGETIEPFEYEGKMLYPISFIGSIVNGIYYEGIDLTNYKITTLTITGNETDADIFNDAVPSEYRVNWKKVLSKYSIGTTVIVITGIVSLCSGTVPLATAGYIASGAFDGAATGAVLGAATDALITGTLSYLKGNPKEQVFKEAIEASADGFMWGAITGAIAGGYKSAKELKKGIPVLSSKGKIQYVVDEKTTIVYQAKGSSPVGESCYKYKNGQYSFFINAKGETVDFDGKIRKIDWNSVLKGNTEGYIRENGTIIGLLDYRDNLIAQGSEIEQVIKECWEPVITCKHIDGNSEYVKLGIPSSASDGKILKRNYEVFYKIKSPKYAHAHHIVPKKQSGEFGEKLREIFEKFNIDINDPHNCVLLAADEVRCKVLRMMHHHKEVHDKKNEIKMLQKLYEDLSPCTSKEQVFEVLADYRQAMMTNTPFWLRGEL